MIRSILPQDAADEASLTLNNQGYDVPLPIDISFLSLAAYRAAVQALQQQTIVGLFLRSPPLDDDPDDDQEAEIEEHISLVAETQGFTTWDILNKQVTTGLRVDVLCIAVQDQTTLTDTHISDALEAIHVLKPTKIWWSTLETLRMGSGDEVKQLFWPAIGFGSHLSDDESFHRLEDVYVPTLAEDWTDVKLILGPLFSEHLADRLSDIFRKLSWEFDQGFTITLIRIRTETPIKTRHSHIKEVNFDDLEF